MKKITFGVLCVLSAGILGAGAVNVYRFHNTTLVLSHYFGGRAGNCTFQEAFEGEALARLQAQNASYLHTVIKKVRMEGRFSLWSTPMGDYWVPSSGDALDYDLGEQRRNIYGTDIHPGDIVLDAGANVGVFTRKALMFGAAKVIAIEPGPENIEALRKTFAPEIADGRVVVYPMGVWDKDDVLKLSVDPSNSARDSFVRTIEHAQFISVPLTTVDKIVAELDLPRVDFIKMDIEGAEQKAIVGAKDTIARFRPRMALCIYHLKEDHIMVPKLVRATVPDYKVRQTCLLARDAVQPEVALFY